MTFDFSCLSQGIEEEDVSPGFVLCDSMNPIKVGRKFDAQLVILEHKSIICAGYSAVMHIHCAAEEITVAVSILKYFTALSIICTCLHSSFYFLLIFQALLCLVDKKTGEKSKTRPRFVKQDQVAIMRIECSGLICLEEFKRFPQMGRFTLRDESKSIHNFENYFNGILIRVILFSFFPDKTIAIGKVLRVIE